jgi:lysophospholipase L1-like esterase
VNLGAVTACSEPAPPAPRAVRVLVVLGDSTAAGFGDPLAGGGWRGVGVLLRDALGATTLVNPARAGARVACVRRDQLAAAVAAAPDAAVVLVGMNDTLRSDFDPAGLLADYRAVIDGLRAVGAHVVVLRYHDHTRVFSLPGPLRRALRARIDALNAVVDAAVAGRAGTSVLDLDALAGAYERPAWAVDRLHPSELGHRLLAAGVAALLAEAGFAAGAVGLEPGGGRVVSAGDRAAWLVLRGVPWLVRRGRDLGPVLVRGLLSDLLPARRGAELLAEPAVGAEPG